MFVIITTIVSKFGSTRAPHTNSEVLFLHFTFVEVIVYIHVVTVDREIFALKIFRRINFRGV